MQEQPPVSKTTFASTRTWRVREALQPNSPPPQLSTSQIAANNTPLSLPPLLLFFAMCGREATWTREAPSSPRTRKLQKKEELYLLSRRSLFTELTHSLSLLPFLPSFLLLCACRRRSVEEGGGGAGGGGGGGGGVRGGGGGPAVRCRCCMKKRRRKKRQLSTST